MPVSRKADLRSKTAVITGAAGGIGWAIAEAFAREGAAIVAMDIKEPEALTGAIEDAGGRALGLRVDVGDAGQVRTAMAEAAAWGGLHILVTCAGVYGRDLSIEVTPEEWDQVMTINLTGTFLCIQAAFPYMREAGGGKIICVGSVGAKAGGMVSGAPYIASKGGVHSLVKWTALRGAAHDIYCNGLSPGVIDTDMIKEHPYRPEYTPLKRFGQPSDVAEVAVFLASDASNYVNGVLLDVDGGYRLD